MLSCAGVPAQDGADAFSLTHIHTYTHTKDLQAAAVALGAIVKAEAALCLSFASRGFEGSLLRLGAAPAPRSGLCLGCSSWDFAAAACVCVCVCVCVCTYKRERRERRAIKGKGYIYIHT